MNELLSVRILIILLSTNLTGCALLVAGWAFDKDNSTRNREVEYRHQERMKELELRENKTVIVDAAVDAPLEIDPGY